MIHFDEMACLLYLEGQLDPARSRELAAHVEECAACRDLLHALQHETHFAFERADRGQRTHARAPCSSEQSRSLPSWVWTLAFGAFAAGAYWFWIDGIGPWFDQLSNAGFGGTDLFSMIVFSGAFWEGWSDMIDAMQIGALILVAIVAIGMDPAPAAAFRGGCRGHVGAAVCTGAAAAGRGGGSAARAIRHAFPPARSFTTT